MPCNCFIHVKNELREKIRYFPLRNSLLLSLFDFDTLLSFPLYYLSTARENKIQTFTTKSDRGRLREVVTCKRQISWFDWETFGILEKGDARYTKSIYSLLSRSVVCSLLCYCVRNRDHCCVPFVT